MAKKKHTPQPQDHAALLALAPEGATRISVTDRTGRTKWRPLDAVEPFDTIMLRHGIPITMKATPGRPPIIEGAANETVADHVRQKTRDLSSDPIVKTARTDPESSDLLHHVVVSLAEEAASLGHERRQAELEGHETSQISVRRVNALKAVAETWLKRKDQTASKEIDLASPQFKAIFAFTLDTFREAMADASLRPEMVEMVFAKLTAKLQEGWEQEARNRMKGAK